MCSKKSRSFRIGSGSDMIHLSVHLLLGSCGLALLAALNAGAFIMFTLTELGEHARLSAGTLKTSECAVQRFISLYMNF